jgi:hypothetical protein
MKSWTWLLFSTLLCAGVLSAAETKPAEDKLQPPEPLGALLEAARAERIPVVLSPEVSDRQTVAVGDVLSLIATLDDGKVARQWLIEVRAQAPTEEDRAAPAYSASQIYISSGSCASFPETRPAYFDVRFVGPFLPAGQKGTPEVKRSHVRLNPHFLGLGLNEAANLMIKLRRSSLPKGFSYAASSKPFPGDMIVRSRSVLEKVNLRLEEERAYAASLPAMLEFFSLSVQTPGMRDLMRRVLDIPWTALVIHGGRVKDVDFSFGSIDEHEAGPWGDTHRLEVNIDILNRPVISTTMFVRRPRPPFLNTAGVVALVAKPPGKAYPRLTFSVLGSEVAAQR